MIITNFAAGELGANINGRVDISQYFQGVSNLSNFDVIPTGGLERRKGTQRIAKLEGECVLIPFIIDKDISFIFEIRPAPAPVTGEAGSNILIWKNGEPSLDEEGKQLVFRGPWTSISEIREIQYAQNYNVIIFVQKDHAPIKLTYNAGTGWSYQEMKFNFQPAVELDDDYNKIRIVQELPEIKGDFGYVIYNGRLYKWNDESGKYELDTSTVDFEIDNNLFTTENNYPGAVAFFNGRLYFAATKNSQQKVWASAAPNLEGVRYEDFSTFITFVTVNKVLKDPNIHYFTADATEGSKTLINVSQDLRGITDLSNYYVSGDNVPVGTKALSATWDGNKGTLELSNPIPLGSKGKLYSIQLWEQRTSASSNDYEYKVVTNAMTSPDNAFFFEIASDQNDGIKWLANAMYLVIGTESATYVMNAQSSAVGQSVVMNGRYGTDEMQATVVDNAVVYFAQGKRGIREYYWNNQINSFRSNNLALLSPQMLMESPALDFDFMTNPYSRIIITREDGTLAVLLYDKNIGVMAWNRIALAQGQIRSVAVVRGDRGYDLIYMIVKHGNDYYMEKLDMAEEVYLDSWKLYKTDLDKENYNQEAVLFNKTKDTVCEDINNIPVDFMEVGDIVYIGYQYLSTVTSMPIINNDTMGKKRITKLVCRFLDSYNPYLKVGDKKEIFTDFKAPFSGLKEIDYPGKSQRDVYFTLSIVKPYKCNILSIDAKLD